MTQQRSTDYTRSPDSAEAQPVNAPTLIAALPTTLLLEQLHITV